MNYQELCPQGTPKAERRKYDIGDIFKNKAKCLKCWEIIISKHRHDYTTGWEDKSIFYKGLKNEDKKATR